MREAYRRLRYRLSRGFVGLFARPIVMGELPEPDREVVYVLHNRSLFDLVLLERIATRTGIHSPLSANQLGEERSFFFLNRPSTWRRKHTMMTLSERMQRMEATLAADETIGCDLVAVSIFWGRGAYKDRSWLHTIVADGWSLSSGFRRLMNLLLNRRDIVVHFHAPIAWSSLIHEEPMAEERGVRRTARLLRVKFRDLRTRVIGPDLSHRRTMIDSVVASPRVVAAIESQLDESSSPRERAKLKRQAQRNALKIASNVTYPFVRIFERLLRWFWNRIYDGVDVFGEEHVAAIASTHTLIYVPAHRSHVDYLLLSYELHQRGFAIPHIAAGQNLDLPVVGSILRRCGAFYMRRRFQGDPVYSAVFAEYLAQMFQRGNSVEYFVEGGRSRTGRLLRPRPGLLQMTIDAHEEGLPRPLALVPVYIGYEKLVEARSYLDELRGAEKKTESIGDVFSTLRLLRQRFGRATLSFAEPIVLEQFLAEPRSDSSARALQLGREILERINKTAVVNAVNLVALATLATPRNAIEAPVLEDQVRLYLDLVTGNAEAEPIVVAPSDPEETIAHVVDLGLLRRETIGPSVVYSHDFTTAVLMTWYRNNSMHLIAAHALIACLIANRRMPLDRAELVTRFGLLFPFIARELRFGGHGDVYRAIDDLERHQLIEIDGEAISPPRFDQPNRLRLTLLSRVVLPTIERYFVAVAAIEASPVDRQTLLAECEARARRVARLWGINAPEFYERRLFDEFLSGLAERGFICVDESSGCISRSPALDELATTWRGVIPPEVRSAGVADTRQSALPSP